MTWLVTGGAGYIGAHVVQALAATGGSVVAFDDLSTGTADRVGDVPLVVGTVLDGDALRSAMDTHQVTGVVHLAAKKQVGESVADPLLYYRENVGGLTTLLSACRDRGVEQCVFSSSASVYGMPDTDLVDEDTPCAPLSPYGQTKLVGEWLIRACAEAGHLRAIALRYFNVAGAGGPGLGDPVCFNLIQIVLRELREGRRPQVFGGDYPTPDGTCIRDYVHVVDLAAAHVAAVQALERGGKAEALNIGRGSGYSVLDVLRVVQQETGLDTGYDVVARRPGDPARVVAAVDRARAELGFTAERDLPEMVASAWAAMTG